MPKGFNGATRFLSNFYPVDFFLPALNGWVKSSEHGFNAMKTLASDEQDKVLSAATPFAAKKVGRRVTLRSDWDGGYRIEAMALNLEAKFALPELRSKLMATGDAELVEYNTWHDNYWGVCICTKHGVKSNGVNMLGQLLMIERAKHTNYTASKDEATAND